MLDLCRTELFSRNLNDTYILLDLSNTEMALVYVKICSLAADTDALTLLDAIATDKDIMKSTRTIDSKLTQQYGLFVWAWLFMMLILASCLLLC